MTLWAIRGCPAIRNPSLMEPSGHPTLSLQVRTLQLFFRISLITTKRAAGASKGCSWACGPNTLPWRGLCLPCFSYTGGNAPCMPGQIRQWCNAELTTAACQPCTGQLPAHYQAWTSDGPFFTTCRADCEPLVSFSAAANGTDCTPCSVLDCKLGELAVQCTPRTDAACVPCTLTGYQPLPADGTMEYTAPGSCQSRCAAGYYNDPLRANSCLSCADLASSCLPGFYLASPCAAPCVPCPYPSFMRAASLPPNMIWGFGCSTRCSYGHVPLTAVPTALPNMTAADGCVPCTPDLCGIGFQGECVSTTAFSSNLLCTGCPALSSVPFPFQGSMRQDTYQSPGSCQVTSTYFNNNPSPSEATATSGQQQQQQVVMGGIARPDLPYPVRSGGREYLA